MTIAARSIRARCRPSPITIPIPISSFRAQTAGTYYFSIEALRGRLRSGGYQLHVSIGPPATAAEISSSRGRRGADQRRAVEPPQPDLRLPAARQPISATASTKPTRTEDFQAFNAAQQAATRQLLQLVANVSSLTFTELTGVDLTTGAGSADLRYAMSTDAASRSPTLIIRPMAARPAAGGTAWYNTTNFNNPLQGNYAWMGILHETGHALGLKHGHEVRRRSAPTTIRSNIR